MYGPTDNIQNYLNHFESNLGIKSPDKLEKFIRFWNQGDLLCFMEPEYSGIKAALWNMEYNEGLLATLIGEAGEFWHPGEEQEELNELFFSIEMGETANFLPVLCEPKGQAERGNRQGMEGVHWKDYIVTAAEIIWITQCVLKWPRSQGDGNRILPIMSRSDFSDCITVCQSAFSPSLSVYFTKKR